MAAMLSRSGWRAERAERSARVDVESAYRFAVGVVATTVAVKTEGREEEENSIPVQQEEVLLMRRRRSTKEQNIDVSLVLREAP
jgi:hypothetical protein